MKGLVTTSVASDAASSPAKADDSARIELEAEKDKIKQVNMCMSVTMCLVCAGV